MMNKLKLALHLVFLTATSLTTLIGCAGAEPEKKSNEFTVEGNYDINAVSLTCSNPEKCTNSLGVVMTISTETEHFYGSKTVVTKVSRCTGSLYSATQVLTAGHCTSGMNKGRSYFRTVATPGRPSQTFEIKRVMRSDFKDADYYTNDYASLELNRPAYNYEYVRAPLEFSKAVTEVVALVVNKPGLADTVFKLDAVECQVDTGSMPAHFADFPNLWGTKSCKLIGGNSGGPVFAAGRLNEVLGVLSKSTEVKEDLLEVISYSSLSTKPRPNLASFANAACFDLPGWPAPAAQCFAINQAFVDKAYKANLLTSLEKESEEIIKEFDESMDADMNFGDGRLKMTIDLVNAEPYFNSSRDGSAGYIFLPLPVCILAETSNGTYRTSAQLGVYKASFVEQSVTLDKVPDELHAEITVKRTAPGKYLLKYNFDRSSGYRPDSEVVKVAGEGVEIELAQCPADQQASALQ